CCLGRAFSRSCGVIGSTYAVILYRLRLTQVAITSYRLYQHHPVDPVSWTLVPLSDLGQFLGTAVLLDGRESHLYSFISQLCPGIAAGVVFPSSAGATLLHHLCSLAGLGQLLPLGGSAVLERARARQTDRTGLVAAIHC